MDYNSNSRKWERLRSYQSLAVIASDYVADTVPIMYCNKFAGSISQWKFITLKAQYTTVDYN
jgi:hypothetical protein